MLTRILDPYRLYLQTTPQGLPTLVWTLVGLRGPHEVPHVPSRPYNGYRVPSRPFGPLVSP
jgi:hypothetical protein